MYDVIETHHASACEAYLKNRLLSRRSRRSDAHEFYEVDPPLLDGEIRGARDFADFLPTRALVQQLAKEPSEDRVVVPGPAELAAHRRLLEVREQIAALEFEEERLAASLEVVIGRASSLDGLATWKTESVTRFNLDSFRLAHPALYGEFLREDQRRRLLIL